MVDEARSTPPEIEVAKIATRGAVLTQLITGATTVLVVLIAVQIAVRNGHEPRHPPTEHSGSGAIESHPSIKSPPRPRFVQPPDDAGDADLGSAPDSLVPPSDQQRIDQLEKSVEQLNAKLDQQNADLKRLVEILKEAKP